MEKSATELFGTADILKISELGLIEMTRKRTRESLIQTLCDPCFYCDGRGVVKSRRTVCYEIFRELTKTQGDIHIKVLELVVHPDIAEIMENEENEGLRKVEKMINKEIKVTGQEDLHLEQFEIKNFEGVKSELTEEGKPPIK